MLSLLDDSFQIDWGILTIRTATFLRTAPQYNLIIEEISKKINNLLDNRLSFFFVQKIILLRCRVTVCKPAQMNGQLSSFIFNLDITKPGCLPGIIINRRSPLIENYRLGNLARSL